MINNSSIFKHEAKGQLIKTFNELVCKEELHWKVSMDTNYRPLFRNGISGVDGTQT